MKLFEDLPDKSKDGRLQKMSARAPLADRMRPCELDEFVGQENLLGKDKILRKIIEDDNLFSMILWGPPGCGKTTLAKIIENKTKNKFMSYSAVVSGIKQIKDVMEIAEYEMKVNKVATILFIDEIHRFNKAQQDAFLPYVENGTIILIGATTENPSFEIINALLSRCKVFVLNKLSPEDILTLTERALKDKERGYGNLNIKIADSTLMLISEISDGDVRFAYNILELAVNKRSDFLSLKENYSPDPGYKIDTQKEGQKEDAIVIDSELIEEILQHKSLFYDKNGEEHFNLISALHKSMRGSDPDASVYWTMRMIEGGEDPLYILRRIIRFASEDIGLADPNALTICISAKEAFEFIGPPEGLLAIIQAVIYCSLSPKSNSLYRTSGVVKEDINKYQALPVPYHIRNAPTKLMKEIGYSKGYLYPHDFKNAIVNQSYLPDKLANKKYYFPSERGFEKELKARIEKILSIKKNRTADTHE